MVVDIDDPLCVAAARSIRKRSNRICPQVRFGLGRSECMSSAAEMDLAHQVFRSRAVVVAGIIEFVFGLVISAVGIGLAALVAGPSALPFGLAFCVLGIVMVIAGLGRMIARMEVGPSQLSWIWSFSRHTIALSELTDCALVEKGSPASGGAWAGFLGGGFLAILLWWLIDTFSAIVRSEPSTGSMELVAIRRYGGPLPIGPICCWSTPASQSQATEALLAVQNAIHLNARPAVKQLPLLRHDSWESPGGA